MVGRAWLFLKEGRVNLAAEAAWVPSYGASQAGAIVRYRLGKAQAFDPFLARAAVPWSRMAGRNWR